MSAPEAPQTPEEEPCVIIVVRDNVRMYKWARGLLGDGEFEYVDVVNFDWDLRS